MGEFRIARSSLLLRLARMSALAMGTLASSSARAQGPSVKATDCRPPAFLAPLSKPQLAAAKRLADNGRKLAKEGQYEAALASFLQAYRIAPHAGYQLEVAGIYRALNDMASAYEATEALLARFGDQLQPDVKKNAQRTLEKLDALTGVVTIDVQEPGARVLVDQKDVGQTPLPKPIRLNIAEHQVVVESAGFDRFTKMVKINGYDRVSIRGPLVRTLATGRLIVETNPPDPTVRIYVDMKNAGAPPYAGEIEPGLHILEARGDKAAAPPRRLSVERGGTYHETLELRSRGGTLVVHVDVPGASIYLDGGLVGRGAYEGPADVGKHALVVRSGDYGAFETELVVSDGQRLEENVVLPPERTGDYPAGVVRDGAGLYVQLNAVGEIAPQAPSNDIAQRVGYTPSTSVATYHAAGGALNSRVGYNLGLIGLEGAFFFGYDRSKSVATMPPGSATPLHDGVTPRTETFTFDRLAATLALGARLIPRGRVLRPELGIAGGISLKEAVYVRSESDLPGGRSFSAVSEPTFYATPTLVVDGGFEIVPTPLYGAHLYVGCVVLADFAPTSSATFKPLGTEPASLPQGVGPKDLPPVTGSVHAATGPELFVGPVVGVRFGR